MYNEGIKRERDDDERRYRNNDIYDGRNSP